jgi:hypothetical protein
MEGFMYITDEDFAKGVEFVQEKAAAYLKEQAAHVEPVRALQEDAAKSTQEIVEDLQSKVRFLSGMEALQAKQTLLMAEGMMVIQNQLAAIIKLLQGLSEVSVDTNVITHWSEINTNMIEENTSLTEEHTRLIAHHTSEH